MKEFSPFDLLDFELVSDPRLSPAGDSVAYVRHTIDPETNTYVANVHTWCDGDSSSLTDGPDTDAHPRWSPDGKWIAFLSNRPANGQKLGRQLWVVPAEGGVPAQLTGVEGGLTGFRWSPSGDKIAVIGRCDPDRGLVEIREETGCEEAPRDRGDLFEKYNADVRHITNIKYKFDGMGFLEGKRSQVGVIPFQPSGPPVAPVTLTSGDFDHLAPCWSPDERWIALSACRAEDPDVQFFADIWVFPVDRPGEPIKVTRSLGPAASPSWSPDGRQIAYLGHGGEIGGGYENTRLWVANVENLGDGDCELADVTGGTDVSLSTTAVMDMCLSGASPDLVWGRDGKTIFHYTAERGTVQVVRVNLEAGTSTLVTTGDRVVYDFDLNPGIGKGVIAFAEATNPGQIALVDVSEEGEGEILAGQFGDEILDPGRQVGEEWIIVRTNEDLLGERVVRVPERFTLPTHDGKYRVDAWFLAPESGGEKVPTVLQIHGGIMGMYTSAFYFELQLLAAAGYGVLFCNPRGSSGYGEDFRAAVAPGWGTSIYPDLMSALDEGLTRYPIDETRLGVAGGSAGGYMTNWCIGHTDRFSAAVSMRSVANKHSMWGTSDNAFLWGERYGGPPWENAEEYLRQSPISYFGGVTTPTLVIHSEEDYRCPIEQGEQVYMTLKKQGVETEFLRYPGESHGLSRSGRPWHRVHRLEKIRDWFGRYL